MTSTTSNSAELHYVLREPEIKSEHPPLLFLLHGVGSNEEDLFSFANLLPPQYLIISVRAPIKIGENSFAWYEVNFSTGRPVFNVTQEQESRAQLIRFISDLKEKYSSSQIYLCGFSQGAIMSYSIGLTRPDLIKGIAVMSGRLLDEIKPLIKKTDILKDLRVFISHGKSDSVLKVEYAREGAEYLRSLGIDPTYKEHEVGHTISKETLADLAHWLRS